MAASALPLATLLAIVAPAAPVIGTAARPQAMQPAPQTAPALPAASDSPSSSPAPAPAQGRPADASALLAVFARMDGLEAGFEEEKQLALLAAPLKSAGRLYFMRPGYLARLVQTPESSTLRITPTELQLSGKDGVERIDLRQSSDVRLFVTSLVQVFLGDEAALRGSFQVGLQPAADSATGWTLTLVPRGAPLDKLMAELRLQGEGSTVTRIEVREPSGDRTVTRILAADVARVFTAEEKTALFGIAPP